uniref:Uncharacterized protein n=1 Tax=Echinococcus granulosus TaxID=6210 RepID=A0A068WSU1_ECHGR|nr:hypothetical protein EgrG_001139800 [Echinococcus granulosus]
MGTSSNDSSLTNQGHDPLYDPHPVYNQFTDIVTIRVGRCPFVIDTEGRERVPACLYALFRNIHVEHLATLDFDDPHSFIMLLNYWRAAPPLEDVRLVAHFLLREARSVEDCLAVVEKQTALFNFNVLKMILKKTRPPILYLDYDTCTTIDESNVVFPLGTFADSRMDGLFPTDMANEDRLQRYCMETNSVVYRQRLSMQIAAINCYVYKDLMCIPCDFHRAVVRNIFYNLCILVREVALREFRNHRISGGPLFMPRAVFKSKYLRLIISKLTYYIAEQLICLDSRWVAQKYAQSNVSSYVDTQEWLDNEEAKMKRRAMMNILCCNINCLWLRGCKLDDFRFDDASSAIVDLFKAEVARRFVPLTPPAGPPNQ